MQTKTRTGFLRPFLGGFALGAVMLVGVQIADPSEASPVPASNARVERIG